MIAASAVADPCRQPLRIFDGARVDLSPLFQWWEKPSEWQKTNARPLSAWVRVSGTLERNAGLGWVVQATVETAPGKSRQETILLKRPPFTEAALFAEATAQRKALEANAEAQRIAVSENRRMATAQRASASRLNQLANDAPSLAREVMPSANARYSVAARYGAAARTAQARSENLTAAAQAQTDRLPEHLKSAARYEVDLFALSTGQKFNGLPVYDPGMMR